MSRLSDYIRRTARKHCSAVVVAAGSSERMGFDKLSADLCGMSVLARTLLALDKSESIDEIVVVTKSEKIPAVAELCREYDISKATKILCGGTTRSESALAGVSEIDPDSELVAIHDGARPLVTDEVIAAAVHAAALYSAAAPFVAAKDTIKITDGEIVSSTPTRGSIAAVQTPQVFNIELIKAALTDAVEKELTITDDCSAVEALGVKVHLVPGDERNIKITTPTDLIIARALLESEGAAE